jgi:hypothetical protein
MKRIIKVLFFVFVELWFIITMLNLFISPCSSWRETWLFQNQIYFLGILLISIIPIFHFMGNKNKIWPWVIAYYQLVFFTPYFLLIMLISD